MKSSLIPFALVLVFSGCSVASNQAVFDEVGASIEERIAAKPLWISSKEGEQKVHDRVRELLAAELTSEKAVQIALVNSRRLQATYEELGIARGDLLEASSFFNPLLSVSGRFPSEGGRTNLEFGITENFLSLLYLPLRRSVAESALKTAKARIGNEVVSVAAEVKSVFYELQGAEQQQELFQTTLEAAEASYIAAKKIREAGNITDLEVQNEQVLYTQTKLELARLETDIRGLREKLNGVLGLWGDMTSWSIAKRLPEIPSEAEDLSALENCALQHRLDLAAAKAEVETAAKVVGMAIPLDIFSESELGVDSERDPDGRWVTGPNISMPIPLFNQGQAVSARSGAQYRAAAFRYYDLAVRIRSEVRAARDKLISLKQQADFIKSELIPLRHAIVAETQLRYNGMLLGLFSLLMAKQSEIEAGKQYIEALKGYWLARTELEHALGRELPVSRDAKAVQVENKNQLSHSH